MATAQQVIDRAYGRLTLTDSPGAAADATTSADMLTVLQDFLAEWAEDSLVEIPPPSALSDELDVPDGQVRAISIYLAFEYADHTGKQITNKLQRMALEAKTRLTGKATVSREMDLSAGGMPNVSRGRYDIATDG